jgi:hypothetical protein
VATRSNSSEARAASEAQNTAAVMKASLVTMRKLQRLRSRIVPYLVLTFTRSGGRQRTNQVVDPGGLGRLGCLTLAINVLFKRLFVSRLLRQSNTGIYSETTEYPVTTH